MPYQLIWEDTGVFVKMHGKLTFSEIMECNGEIYGDSSFDYLKYEIGDFLDVESFEVSEKETLTISRLEIQSANWNKFLKVAHVTRDKKIIELIELYKEALKDTNWEIDIFNTIEEAYAWVEQS